MTLPPHATTGLPALRAPPVPDPAQVALFLDVDGTLLDFAPHPDAVRVDPALPALLGALWRRLDGALAPVSGRPLGQVDRLLGLPPGAAAGLHGAQWREADGTPGLYAHDEAVVADLLAQAHACTAAMPGVLVESKPNALALHFRNAPDAEAAVRRVADELAWRAGARFTLQHGDHVIELKPAGIDKGDAVARLMRAPPFARRTPWMLGDDHTDEHAFDVAQSLGGKAIVVGSRRPTRADWALADPAAVLAWLAALLSAPAGVDA
ncbi:MAG: trehalose-phosphatase [Lysobacteraceae bacterium]|nr:MAG: trehalose-phosphatase [Xanthomonadaceae bacterium]